MRFSCLTRNKITNTLFFIEYQKTRFRSFSCRCGGRFDIESEGGGATLESGNAALMLLLLVALLTLVDEIFAASQHEVHHPGKLVRNGGVRPRLVHSAGHPTVERAECGVAACQTHRCHLEGLAHAVSRTLGFGREYLAATDLGARAQTQINLDPP